MRPTRFAFALAVCLAFAAPAPAQDADTGALALPATLEGTLVIDVPAAEVENNTTQSNFGTLTVDGVDYAVDVPTPVLEKAGLPAEGGAVRATLGSGDDGDGFMVYTVTALEKR
jgi:hypothetical protein